MTLTAALFHFNERVPLAGARHLAQNPRPMKRFICTFAMLTLTLNATGKPNMASYTKSSTKSKLTVVHAGAAWNPASAKMWPEWTKFATKFQGRLTLVNVDTENKAAPEYKKFEPLLRQATSLPVTLWLDEKGEVLTDRQGFLEAGQLEKETSPLLNPPRKSPKKAK